VLVASFSDVDLDVLAAAVDAGVDAVEIPFSKAIDARRLLQITEHLKVPVGLLLPAGADASMAATAAEARVDWVRLPLAARVSSLEWEKPARVLTVPFDLDLHLAQGLSGLPIDAVVVDQVADGQSELTCAEALRFRTLSELVKKPLILHVGPALPPAAAAAGEHLGADGLLVDVDGLRSIDTLRSYLQGLEAHSEHR